MCSRVFPERLIAVSCQSCTGDAVSTLLHPLVGLVTTPAGERLKVVALTISARQLCAIPYLSIHLRKFRSLLRLFVCSCCKEIFESPVHCRLGKSLWKIPDSLGISF
jgi:hypothetical protein